MSNRGAASIFTREEPLGPTSVSSEIDPEILRLIYDHTAEPHRLSQKQPPSFIVGRRGSGKTTLLLSAHLDATNLVVHLRSDGIFSRVSGTVRNWKDRIILTEEGVADIWSMLLWGPVINRLIQVQNDRDPAGEYMMLWEELAPLRNAVSESAQSGTRQDDVVLDFMTQERLKLLSSDRSILAADTISNRFQLYARPWTECIDAARQLIRSRGTPVFVLIDSIENIGPQLSQLELTIRGLFHLVGRIGLDPIGSGYRLQCCFPSELWPNLHRISANPLKDFARATLLQWEAKDLLHIANVRLEEFFEQRPLLRHGKPEPTLTDLLPKTIRNQLGVQEPPLSYMLRHTQLLPRQFIHILNRAMSNAIDITGLPFMREADIISAVSSVEAILCPEIYSAYSHVYPKARDIAHRLVPYLPFRFNDDFLHQMCNQAGIRKLYELEYQEVRTMFARLGILGRYMGEEGYYQRAEFEYAVDGTLNLAAEDTYCLHPLFVRDCKSRDVRLPTAGTKPVYPTGTPGPGGNAWAE